MAILSSHSLDFAKAHIEAFYDSDFFPKPEEYAALWANWDHVKAYLTSSNVEKLAVVTPRAFPAPKHRGGYRIVHQLEPLNALVYTALAYMISPDVEATRMPTSKKAVFSYRLSLSENSFFAAGNGYADFIDRCAELASSHQYVLVADIADFYNRLYLHRLNNAISYASSALANVAKAIEDFLTRLNSKSSQGVPIGPAASIVMSEATLIDLDQYLYYTKGYLHARYVDDIRIFSDSESDLRILEEDLSSFLYDAHRLQLAWQKTTVLPCQEYVQKYLETPTTVERRELLGAARAICDYGDLYVEDDIDELCKKFLNETEQPPAPISAHAGRMRNILQFFKEIETQEKRRVRSYAFNQLLIHAVSTAVIDIGLIRHTLRRSRSFKVNDLVPTVLENFERLGPVIADAFLYLQGVTTPELVAKHLELFRNLLGSSLVHSSRLARFWMHWYFSAHCEFVEDGVIGPDLWKHAAIEHQARAARTIRNLAWVRGQKAHLSNLGLWDKRATLLAAEVMPLDERKAWLSSLSGANLDLVDESIRAWLASRP